MWPGSHRRRVSLRLAAGVPGGGRRSRGRSSFIHERVEPRGERSQGHRLVTNPRARLISQSILRSRTMNGKPSVQLMDQQGTHRAGARRVAAQRRRGVARRRPAAGAARRRPTPRAPSPRPAAPRPRLPPAAHSALSDTLPVSTVHSIICSMIDKNRISIYLWKEPN